MSDDNNKHPHPNPECCNDIVPCEVPQFTLPILTPVDFSKFIIDYEMFMHCICPPSRCTSRVNYRLFDTIAVNNTAVLAVNIASNLADYVAQFVSSLGQWLLNIISYILCSIGNYNRFVITTLADTDLLAYSCTATEPTTDLTPPAAPTPVNPGVNRCQTAVAEWLFGFGATILGTSPLPLARDTSNPQNLSLSLVKAFGIDDIKNNFITVVNEQQAMLNNMLKPTDINESSIKKIDVDVFTDDLSTKIDGVFTQFNNVSADELAVLKSAVLEVAEKVVTDVNEKL